MARRRTLSLLALTALAAAPVAAGCGGSSEGSAASGSEVSVRASDTACEVARTTLDAGSTTFAVRNSGSKVTEVYVYGAKDGAFTKVVSEVENIGPGTSRDMTVTLAGGTYEVACKPGQTGDGIRTKITVTGSGSGAGASASASGEAGESEGGYDREISLATDGTAITGLTGGAEKGEKIEFKLANNAGAERTLELKAPSGTVAGEVEDIEPGETGELVVTLDQAGTWQVVVEGEGVADVTAPLTVS